jgi:hypothetical protein
VRFEQLSRFHPIRKTAAAQNGGKHEKRRWRVNTVQREARELPLQWQLCGDKPGATRRVCKLCPCSGNMGAWRGKCDKKEQTQRKDARREKKAKA